MSAASDLDEYILGLDLPPFIIGNLILKVKAAMREAPEGQRAGEEWRALCGFYDNFKDRPHRFAHDAVRFDPTCIDCRITLAVERSRQP